MDAGNFLRALMRDVAWGFFYGWVNFDNVFGTVNHYQSVDLYAGSYNGTMKEAGIDLLENFPTEQIRSDLRADARRLDQRRLRPVRRAAGDRHGVRPQERQQHREDHARARELAKRCVGLKDDLALRTDERGAPVNRAFADVPQDQPELHPEPGFENEVHAFNLFGFLAART